METPPTQSTLGSELVAVNVPSEYSVCPAYVPVTDSVSPTARSVLLTVRFNVLVPGLCPFVLLASLPSLLTGFARKPHAATLATRSTTEARRRIDPPSWRNFNLL